MTGCMFDEAKSGHLVLEVHKLPLQMKFDEARQFYLTIPVSELEDRALPEVFIHVFRKKNHVECQTLDLWKRSQRVIYPIFHLRLHYELKEYS